MRRSLSGFVLVFGAVCCLIALTHILIGHDVVPGHAPGFSPNDDSEDRFYASLFLGFGCALIWCSRDMKGRSQVFGGLMIVFFIGGIARLLSAAEMGMPSPLFQFLGALELVMPPLLWWAHKHCEQDL